MLEQFIKYVVGEAPVIAQAPILFGLAILVACIVMWRALSWRYAGIIANADSDLKSAQAQIVTLKEQTPKGALAKEPLEFATEKDALVIPISATKYTVLFKTPLRVTPSVTFQEPDLKGTDTRLMKLEYWSPMGFTNEFPPGTTFKQLRFTANARK